MRKYVLPSLFLVFVVSGVAIWLSSTTSASPVSFRTERIGKGELLAAVSATGTLEPVEVLDVGAQVVGQIKEFGTGADGKTIDYGSPVEPGTVLARIDDSLYKAQVEQSRALLRSAERQLDSAKAKVDSAKAKVEQANANVQRADADLKAAKAKSNQTSRDWERAKQTEGSISQADFDAARANYESNLAGVGVAEAATVQARAAEVDSRAAVIDAEAAVGTAEAAVAKAKADLQRDETSLSYCTIASPVKGTIIDRRVTIGQTVQSSFNAPSLFLIAKDLKKIEVWASVNEADISQVRFGQAVRFSVDAYPNETFHGTVARTRLNATNTQNVVIYTVEVLTDNADGRLLPYMTANLQFEVDKRNDAVLVPNSALRYRPSPQAIAPEVKASKEKGNNKAAEGDGDKAGHGIVWVPDDTGHVRLIRLRIGLTDGNNTEVLGGELELGASVVVGESKPGSVGSSEVTNPFAAPRFGGKKS